MRILIVGEYSGFAKNLKLGFEKIGHEVILFHEGDDWKKIDTGKNSYSFSFCRNYHLFGLNIPRSWRLRGLFYHFKFRKAISNYKKHFDGALIINYEFIRHSKEWGVPRFSMYDLKNVMKENAKIYLSACGDDFAYVNYVPKFRYTHYQDYKYSCYLKPRLFSIWNEVKGSIDGVIPVMCDYALAYRELAKKENIRLFNTIPLPISVDNIQSWNKIEDKIVIFHGLNRASKGTAIILKALEYIRVHYNDKVEVVVDGRLPLEEYLKLLKRTNIIIDQCYSYAYGMNTIYGMAMGKVVLSGNEPESSREFGVDEIPLINITPDVNDIISKLELLINNPNMILDMGERAAKFVKQNHEAKLVAREYIKIFNQ